MSSKRNVNILADQHHSHSLPPYQPGYTTGPPVLSPVSAPASHQHTPQILPALSSLSNPRYPPPPPPPPAPPPLHHSSSQSRPEPQEKQDHGYNGPQSGQATPIIRNHGEPPYHRTSSTPVPSQGQAPPPLDRPPMENGHTAQPLYAAPPHPEQHHLMYPPQHHPGPPMMDHGPYAPHPGYHAAPGYMYPSIHMTNQNTRKKSMRASQACDKCRERKSKCDEQRPCATCKEQNIECHYKDSQPSKVDKSNAQITETLQNIADGIQALNDRMNRLEERSMNTSEDRKSTTTVTFKAEDMSRRHSRNDTPALAGQDSDGAMDLANLRQPGNAGSYDFAEHTTATHKLLLRWPSVARLFTPEQHPYPANYVLHHENRGCLRLYGRGERVHDEDKIAIGAASPAQSARSDETHAPSPDMFNGFDEPKRSEPGHPTSLDMDSRTLYRLFDKYKKHIHRLHPFLDIDVFGKYIRTFINDHNTDSTKLPYSPHNMFIANGGNESQKAGLKRKRSEALGPSSFSSSDSGKRKVVKPAPRTLSNAIVYLVFALGKVCETVTIPGPLDPVPYSSATGQAQPGASPIIRPSPSSPHSVYGYTPPAGETFRTESRGSSFEDSPGMEKKNATNVDTMPGLNYYREAVSILGDFADANDLASAQARLLAALYKGQLARVQESWGWLYNASRTCQYLIRMEGLNNTYNPQMVFDKNKNLTLLAYWTCLQLESDILAELDYPVSGLSSVEGIVNWPNNVLDEEASRKIVSESATELDLINIYYSAQLFLRKHLNQIHTRLYSVDLARRDPKELSDTLDDLDETLQGWRNLPHPITFWDDEQPPHPDILAARLRAKYYGARYVTTRPFLDYALHVMEEDDSKKLEEVTVDARGKRRRQELVLFQAIQMMPQETIRHKVKICIDSAKKSTIALDSVNDHRLIVTNIMGTAHAQFGNILVLAAVSRSNQPWLKELVSMADLRIYLNRTIRFLVKLRDASATATEDLRLLTDLRINLRLTLSDDDSYNS